MCGAKFMNNSVKNSSHEKDKSLITYTYEEAVERALVGKFHYFLLLIGGMCFMAFISEISGLGFIMFPAKCELKFSLTQQGLLGSAGFLGVTVSACAIGFLADTWGRLRTLKKMVFISICTSLISSLSSNVWMLFVFRFLTGVFISGCQACVFSLVGEFHSRRTRIKHVSMVSIFLPAGLVYLPGLAVMILPLNIDVTILGITILPWRILMFCNPIPSIIALVGCFFIPESPKYLLGQGRHEECVEVLRKVYSINTGNPKNTYPCNIITLKDVGSNVKINGLKDVLSQICKQTASLFSQERALQTINMCAITFTINLIAQGTFLYFPVILNNLISHSDQSLTVCEAIRFAGHKSSNQTLEEICANPESLNIQQYEFLFGIGWCFMFFYFFISIIIDITGKKPLLVTWLAVAGLSSVVLHWIDNFYLILAVLTMIVAIANCVGVMTTFALEFYPTSVNAMGVSFVNVIGRLGAVVGTNIVGPILFSNCDTLFFSYGFVTAFICLLAYYLPRQSRK